MEYISNKKSSAGPVSVSVDAGLESYSMLISDSDDALLRYIDQSSYPWVDDLGQMDHEIKHKIVRVSTPFTLIPSAEFDVAAIKRIAAQAFPFESVDHVDHFHHNGITAVYPIDNALKHAIAQQFPGFTCEHILQSLLLKKKDQAPSVHAHWTRDGIIIIAYHEGFRIANFYKTTTPEDSIYYILSAFQYADLDPLVQPLQLSGRISKDGILFDKISGFIRDFDWKNKDYNLPADFPFDPHVFYHLT